MRFVVICLLILAIMFLGHSIYSRSRVNKLLDQAVGQLPASPTQSYNTMKQVFEFNNLVSMGKSGAAEQTYLRTVRQTLTQALANPAVGAANFDQAQEALRVLKDFQQRTGLDTRQAQTAITQAAKDATARIKEQGTLSAWNGMLSFFKTMNEAGLIPPLVFEDFNAWLAEVEKVPRRPLGLRDAIVNASAALSSALGQIGMTASRQDGAFVLAPPTPLTDQQLIAAEKALNQGLEALNQFKSLFKESRTPPELAGLQAKILYNRAALKLAHLQERGSSINASGSNYIADLLIQPGTATVPTVAEMVSAFIQGAQGDFQQAGQFFPQAASLPEPLRQAYAALAAWGEGLLAAFMPGVAQASIFAKAEGLTAGVGGSAAAIPQAMRASQRVLMIVQAP